MAGPEGRTQAPSQRRRLMARERGIVARSPVLTGAAAMLMAVLLLGAWGDDLGAALLDAARQSWSDVDPRRATDATTVASQVFQIASDLFAPLASLLGGTVLAGLIAHQAQVGGLWLPGMLAPNPARLWRLGEGTDMADRSFRGAWSMARALVVVFVASWALWDHRHEVVSLGALDAPELMTSGASLTRSVLLELALALLALGALDYAAQHQRVETLLRSTPEEHREDLKAVDGDPALRARRRRMAQSWKFDPIEAVTGASLLLIGAQGLTLVLGGGPPPRKRVLVRAIAQGTDGHRLRQAAEQMGLARLESVEVARHMAKRDRAPLPPKLVAELAAAWPPRSRANET